MLNLFLSLGIFTLIVSAWIIGWIYGFRSGLDHRAKLDNAKKNR